MKTTPKWPEAVAALGLPTGFKVRTASDIDRAMNAWKAREVHLRRSGSQDDSRANSQIREMIRRLGKKFCRCGNVKSPAAQNCQICHRKTLQNQQIEFKGDGSAREKPPGANSNARVHFTPVGGPLAEIGYFSTPVQKVARKWIPVIGSERFEDYYIEIACPVIESRRGNSKITLQVDRQNNNDWPAIFEIGNAIAQVMSRKDKPEYWLLTMPEIFVGTGFEFEGWQEISARIVRWGGLKFLPNTLAATYSKLRMNTIKSESTAWRKHRAAVVTK